MHADLAFGPRIGEDAGDVFGAPCRRSCLQQLTSMLIGMCNADWTAHWPKMPVSLLKYLLLNATAALQDFTKAKALDLELSDVDSGW